MSCMKKKKYIFVKLICEHRWNSLNKSHFLQKCLCRPIWKQCLWWKFLLFALFSFTFFPPHINIISDKQPELSKVKVFLKGNSITTCWLPLLTATFIFFLMIADYFTVSHTLFVFLCTSRFCQRCLNQSFRFRTHCPYCRSSVSANNSLVIIKCPVINTSISVSGVH